MRLCFIKDLHERVYEFFFAVLLTKWNLLFNFRINEIKLITERDHDKKSTR